MQTVIHAYTVILISLALLVRAAVPAGWMLMPDPATGHMTLQLCPGEIGIVAPQTHMQHHEMSRIHPASSHSHGDMGHPDTEDLISHSTHELDPGQDTPEHFKQGMTCPYALTATFDVPKDDALIQTAFFGPPLLADVPVVAAPDARAARPPLPPRGPPVRV